MDVRKFTWADLPKLTTLMGLANPSAEGLNTEERLAEDLGRPGLHPEDNCALFEEGGDLVAASLIHPELLISRAVLEMWAHPKHIGPSLQSTVVQKAIFHAKSMGSRVLHVCVSPSGPWPVLVEKEGLAKVRTYWLMRWQEPSLPLVEVPEGLKLGRYRPGNAEELTVIQNAAFGGHWGFCPNTPDEIAYRAEMSISPHDGILLLRSDAATVGYCWTCTLGDVPHSTGVISMIGIDPAYRGKGLSRPVLLAGMEYLRSRDVQYVQLDVDSENTPAVKLYSSIGFKVVEELHWFEASL
ncbi:MAG: GNAT family N-acetyltransferase [Dehalococcoidia bacterium]|nr:GNAT family N-acetyltransferase [Dehalococcoidia bacterium]